jgi:hypothetical protein
MQACNPVNQLSAMVKIGNPVFEKFAMGRTGVPAWGFVVLASSHRGTSMWS